MADGGGDVPAAEEESLHLVAGSLSHGGAVETVVEGGVGDKGREEGFQVGFVCCVGSEIGIPCANSITIYGSCFNCRG